MQAEALILNKNSDDLKGRLEFPVPMLLLLKVINPIKG